MLTGLFEPVLVPFAIESLLYRYKVDVVSISFIYYLHFQIRIVLVTIFGSECFIDGAFVKQRADLFVVQLYRVLKTSEIVVEQKMEVFVFDSIDATVVARFEFNHVAPANGAFT